MADVMSRVTSESRAKQSEYILKKLLTHPRFKVARNVSIYLSTNKEVDTIPLVEHVLEKTDKFCYIPYIPKRRISSSVSSNTSRMQMVRLESMQKFSNLPTNHYGIKEPDEKLASEMAKFCPDNDDFLDLVIVPGVAFTKDGHRLGHGKGYYDEFLNYLSSYKQAEKGETYTIGIALREQIVDDTFSIEHEDFRLNEVITAS